MDKNVAVVKEWLEFLSFWQLLQVSYLVSKTLTKKAEELERSDAYINN